MTQKRRSFPRQLGQLRYRKLFIIAVEGVKTEPQYFGIFSNQSIIKVKCLKSGHDSSPPQVLDRMKIYLKNEGLKSTDEAWLVVDKDQWSNEQVNLLYTWSQTQSNYGFALSNPNFEYWLLLHFDNGNGIANSRECSIRLKQYVPNYDKGINATDYTMERIKEAIGRAKRRDTPPCQDWPHHAGSTTVYRLVGNILGAAATHASS